MLRRVALVAVTVLMAANVLAGCGGSRRGRPPNGRPEAPLTTAGTLPAATGGLQAGDDAEQSTVAQATGAAVALYDTPDAPAPRSQLANPQPSGAPLVFLVEEQRDPWLRVLLPVRPNGSTAWIRQDQVALSANPYRIVVELGAHQITVYLGHDVFDREPVGVGKASTATPPGRYYLKELLQPPNPKGAYGPYAYGLSGFSTVLTDFNGGDGVIGIHGTNEPSTIGRDTSHGCIRMSNAGITKLAKVLPLGVPVDIVA